MTVRKIVLPDGTKRWEVRTDVGQPDGSRKQIRRRYKTEAEAKRAHAATRVQVATGAYVAKSRETVGGYLSSWVEGRIDVRSTTRAGYRAVLRPLIRTFGDMPIQKLSKTDLDKWVASRLAEGVSARTVNLPLTILARALKDAQRENLVTVNVAALVNRPKSAQRVQAHAWTSDECRRYLTQASTTRESALWHLTMLGLRRGEVLGLRWEDVDLEARVLQVRQSRVLEGGRVVTNEPKSKRGRRTVPLPAETAAQLRQFRNLQRQERLALGGASESLVAVDAASRPLRPEWYSHEFHRISDAAGLPRIRLHDARHSAASLLASLRVPVAIAADILGHDPVVYSTIYAHAYDDDKREAMARLGQVLSAR